MCLLVFVGNYLCGHLRWPSHGFPDDFIRECDDRANFQYCDLLPSQDDIPWLCPHCHWTYVQQNLAPLWLQTTITKCRTLQDAQMFPAEPTYLQSQKAADRLELTFEAQQAAVRLSTVGWHKLRDKTLRSYLGENFRSCLMAAHEANRPWSLAYVRDPFTCTLSDVEMGFGLRSPSSDDSLFDLASPDPSELEVHPITGEYIVRPHAELGSVLSSNSSSPRQTGSEAGSEDLPCFWCPNHGSFAGVTVDQRVCITCRESGIIDDTGAVETVMGTPRSSSVEARERQSDEAMDNNAPAGSDAPPDTAPDLSSLPVGAPETIPSAHRGTLEHFLAARRERSNSDRRPIQHVTGFDLDGPPQRRRRLNSVDHDDKEW